MIVSLGVGDVCHSCSSCCERRAASALMTFVNDAAEVVSAEKLAVGYYVLVYRQSLFVLRQALSLLLFSARASPHKLSSKVRAPFFHCFFAIFPLLLFSARISPHKLSSKVRAPFLHCFFAIFSLLLFCARASAHKLPSSMVQFTYKHNFQTNTHIKTL